MLSRTSLRILAVAAVIAVAVGAGSWIQARRQAMRPASYPPGWTNHTTRFLHLVQDVNRGKRLLDDGRLDEAVAALQEVIKKYPGDPHAYEARLRLGVARRRQKRFEEAKAQFHKVIRECPFRYQQARGWLEIGRTEDAQGDRRRAIATFQKVIDEFPKETDVCPEAYMAQAKTYRKIGDLPAAQAALQRIIRDYPGREREWEIEAKVVLKAIAKQQAERLTQAAADAAGRWEARVLRGPVEKPMEIGPGVFIVAKPLTVKPGAVLRIRAGSTLRFMLNARLIVQGALECRGEASRPVVFASAYAKPRPFDWEGVAFAPSAAGSGSRLAWCRIEFARIGVECDAASPALERCRIVRCGRVGVVLKNQSSARMTACEVERCEGDGAQCRRLGEPVIQDCSIRGNAGAGLTVSMMCAAKVRDNTIAENGGDGVVCVESSKAEYVGNRVQANRGAGVTCRRAAPRIASNVIEENIGPGLACRTQSAPAVESNTIRANAGGGALCQASSPTLRGNRIEGNLAFGLCCEAGARPKCEGNVIASDNGPCILVRGGAAPILHGNSIVGAARWALRNESAADVDAARNWWGTPNAAEAAKRIFDAAGAAASGKVNIEPLLTQPPRLAGSK